ncbi:MAG: hypothetical protein R3C15_20190 [Thermoleophilia bacterium]
MPRRAEELLAPTGDDPCDPAAVGGLAAAAVPGVQPALPHGRLLVLLAGARGDAVLLRAVQCEPFDPQAVTVWLARRGSGALPEVPGLAARLRAPGRRRARRLLAAWPDAGDPAVAQLDRCSTPRGRAVRLAGERRGGRAGAPACSLDATVSALRPGRQAGERAAEAAAAVRADANPRGSSLALRAKSVTALPPTPQA